MTAPPPAETLAAADALRRANTLLQRRLRGLRSPHGVSGSKLMALAHLFRAPAPLTAVDLARLDGLQPQSLTRIIAELHDAGLLSRRPDPGDKRQVLLEITPAGRALLAADARRQTVWLADAMAARLTPTERALLGMAAGLVEKLVG